MINRLIEFSLKNRFLVVLAYLLLAGWGYWALLSTPIDAIPDLSENQVIVFTDWPGRSPQEVEDQITYPLTVNLAGTSGRADGPLVFRVRILDGQYHLRGFRRCVFRTDARARTTESRFKLPACRMLSRRWVPTQQESDRCSGTPSKVLTIRRHCGRCRIGSSAIN